MNIKESLAIDHANQVSDPEWAEWHGRYASYKAGHSQAIRLVINKLRELQDKAGHQSEWNHSRDPKFAPVELSDWILREIYNK